MRYRWMLTGLGMMLMIAPLAPVLLSLPVAVAQTVQERGAEAIRLNKEGKQLEQTGSWQAALEKYQQALTIFRTIGNRQGAGAMLNNLGSLYLSLGQYPKALEFCQQALAISKDVGDRRGEAVALNNIGKVYQNLGQYRAAMNFYEQALVTSKEIGDREGESTILDNIGLFYADLRLSSIALSYFQQALTIRKELRDRGGQGRTLNNIGSAYTDLREYTKAIDFYQQALIISEEVGDRGAESSILNNIGLNYDKTNQYAKALNFYQQALTISKEVGDRPGEGGTLNNIGYTLESQNQPELAILFFKQSVNVYESIRKDNRQLTREQQKSYIQTIANTYRKLADLLLKQDRILEAQRVLDLLKVQELDDFLRNVRGTANSAQGVDLLPTQQQIWDAYDAHLSKLVQLGKALTVLEDIQKTRNLTSAEDQRRIELDTQQRQAQAEFTAYLTTDRVQKLVADLGKITGGEGVNPKLLSNLQDNLRQLQNAVILYPIIFDDRLELVLATPYAPPIRRPVPVTRQEFNATLVEFRQALSNPRSDAKVPAQKLYNWLIKPLEGPLKEAFKDPTQPKTILYAPDGQLRYIPLAALYDRNQPDGKQWLAQRFAINNITALSLTDVGKPARGPLKILAGAYTDQGKPVNFTVGNQPFAFQGLRFAGIEVKNLVSLIPGTTQILNDGFSLVQLLNQMRPYSILHLATHAEFINGKPEDSFILMGNGDRARFRDLDNPANGIESWQLPNTDLVVLSACNTAEGTQQEDGKEILGFGYLMQQAGARAAISSLWSVDDGGTQALMDAFYAHLKSGKFSKVEALRQAQVELITGKQTGTGVNRATLQPKGQLPQTVSDRLDHPYYWAPFILIGNGL